MTLARALTFASSLSFVVSCVSSSEGDALKRDVETLRTEMAEMQRASGDARNQQVASLDDMKRRVGELETTLANLRQADADTGVQLDKIVAELQTLRGEVEQARHELGETQQSVKGILDRPPAEILRGETAVVDDPKTPPTLAGQTVPAEPRPHYDLAKKLYDDKNYVESAAGFDLFLQRHASHELASNAAFWKAESYFAQAGTQPDAKAKEKSLKQAILAYQRVLEDPNSPKNDGALYKIGMAFEQLGFKDEAVVFYDELVTKHPKSTLNGEAKKRLKSLGGPKKKKPK